MAINTQLDVKNGSTNRLSNLSNSLSRAASMMLHSSITSRSMRKGGLEKMSIISRLSEKDNSNTSSTRCLMRSVMLFYPGLVHLNIILSLMLLQYLPRLKAILLWMNFTKTKGISVGRKVIVKCAGMFPRANGTLLINGKTWCIMNLTKTTLMRSSGISVMTDTKTNTVNLALTVRSIVDDEKGAKTIAITWNQSIQTSSSSNNLMSTRRFLKSNSEVVTTKRNIMRVLKKIVVTAVIEVRHVLAMKDKSLITQMTSTRKRIGTMNLVQHVRAVNQLPRRIRSAIRSKCTRVSFQ